MTAADRPPVTDSARAEVERRAENVAAWNTPEYVEGYKYGFRRGAQWAAGRAETTTDPVGDAYMLGYSAAKNAETTTATTEDIDRLAHSKDVRVYGDYGAGWRDGVKAAAGLLAMDRTRPTEDIRAKAENIIEGIIDYSGDLPPGQPSRAARARNVTGALAEFGLLARPTPSREDLVVAIGHNGEWCRDGEKRDGSCCDAGSIATAVLDLLEGGTEVATAADTRDVARVLAYLLDDFTAQHRAVLLDKPEEGYGGMAWHEWAEGTRTGMERLIHTVRHLLEHPSYAARLIATHVHITEKGGTDE